jgi:hypothetical protein
MTKPERFERLPNDLGAVETHIKRRLAEEVHA